MNKGTIYLTCDSTYRNRNIYPYQADFVVPFSKTLTPQTYNQVDDTVMKGTIVYVWTGGYGYSGSTGTYVGVGRYYSEGTFKTGSTDSIPLLQQTTNSSVSSSASETITDNNYVTYPTIPYYYYTSPPDDIYDLLVVEMPFYSPPSTLPTGYPNALPLITYAPNINVLISAGGGTGTGPTVIAPYSNYYKGCGVADVNTNETRIILTYSPQLAGITNVTSLTNSSVGDSYVIYDPSSSAIIHLNTYDTLGRPIIVIENAFTNYYIIDETMTADSYFSSFGAIVYRKIVAYDYTTQLATLDSPFPSGWSSTDVYTLREKLPDEWQMVLQVYPLTNNQYTIQLTYFASAIDNFYTNRFFYKLPFVVRNIPLAIFASGTDFSSNVIWDGVFVNGNSITDFYYVISYDGTARTAVIQSLNGSSPLVSGSLINVCSFSMDNEQPLLYSGSMVSQQEDVSYEVSISNLVVPNVNMSVGPRIVQYPFVYVGLEAFSSSKGNNIVMYSNNPSSRKALFLVTTTNTTIPQITPFLRTDSGNVAVTIKIKPNDSLRFTMWLPDGSLYKTEEIDSIEPYQPNFLLQIICTFSFTKL